MDENALLSDPCFLEILSSKEQKYVDETIFPGRQLVLQTTSNAVTQSEVQVRPSILEQHPTTRPSD